MPASMAATQGKGNGPRKGQSGPGTRDLRGAGGRRPKMHDRRIRHLVVLDQGAAAGVPSVRDVMSVFLPERVHRQEA